jgi:hypothetical protein
VGFVVVSKTCSSTLNAGQPCDYLISFRPRSTGTKSEVFKVSDNINSPQKVQLHGVTSNPDKGSQLKFYGGRFLMLTVPRLRHAATG